MKYLFCFFYFVFCCSGSFAASKETGQQFRDDWGVTENWKSCSGETAWNKEKNRDDAWQRYKERKGVQEVLLLVARDIRAHGAYFCTMHVGGMRHHCLSESYTAYYETKEKFCFWACEEGYAGDGCLEGQGFDSCNANVFDFFKDVSGYGVLQNGETSSLSSNPANIEDDVPMFSMNNYIKCSGGDDYDFQKMQALVQEHDVILAIKDIDLKNNQLMAQPVVVRAGMIKNFNLEFGLSSYSYCEHAAWPVLDWDQHSQKKLCPDGWKHTSKGCELSDAKVCALETLCPSTPSDKFNASIHTTENKKKYVNSGLSLPSDCSTVFRCRTGAFASTTDFSCVECSGATMGPGVDGTCLKCPTGFLYDREDLQCKEPEINLSHVDMLYGKGKAEATELSELCWYYLDPKCYKSCVVGGASNLDETCKPSQNSK